MSKSFLDIGAPVVVGVLIDIGELVETELFTTGVVSTIYVLLELHTLIIVAMTVIAASPPAAVIFGYLLAP